MEKIPVDKYCRMDLEELRKRLEVCLTNRIPVLGVTAVFGTTQVLVRLTKIIITGVTLLSG